MTADVVDRNDLLDDDLAGADVHRDLGELDAEGEDAHAGRVRPAGALAENLPVVEKAGDLLERPRAPVRGDDLAAFQGQHSLFELEALRGELDHLARGIGGGGTHCRPHGRERR